LTTIRGEREEDLDAIADLIARAFAGMPFSDGTEVGLPAALRADGAVTVGLVAEREGRVVGQATFSPVTIDGRASAWHGLGPVAVEPDLQGQGIGTALIEDGLKRLKELGSAGCVVTGSSYYRRFGFFNSERMRIEGYPPTDFMVLPFAEEADGLVAFHPAFD
jgi:putative acetyltransferase